VVDLIGQFFDMVSQKSHLAPCGFDATSDWGAIEQPLTSGQYKYRGRAGGQMVTSDPSLSTIIG
jgi:hypothetical protein